MNTSSVAIGVVGATGLVGSTFLDILEEQTDFSIEQLLLFASSKSAGKRIKFKKKNLVVEEPSLRRMKELDVVFFSGGDDLSKEWAPKLVENNVWVIDNSSTFRLHPDIPLIVPEINGNLLQNLKKPQIIANPNCTTIQLCMVLHALRSLKVTQVWMASYQAVSGAGKEARQELLTQIGQKKLIKTSRHFACSLAFNVVPQIGRISESGFSEEEIKVIKESKKILNLHSLKISAFTVRVPVLNGHSMAVWVRFEKATSLEEITTLLENMSGIQVMPMPHQIAEVTPKMISGSNMVYVGRIHQDLDDPTQWLFWIVADNLRKGAAWNGFQIFQSLAPLIKFKT
ncbi:MAG: aspartate-semialdehyde dehydrogenase [Bdellovibrionaceae bacterium]|nr:aspartate-semialdehyde dehydrogenase [Pseudobdellovibrionaceae bacterium]MDW8189970.1 aspartate-semialdehyde dehydrogenase [Pseudobdellovibrionaceae bacterium]